MKAMILAAGKGERMRPLTDTCPKPLLTVRGKPLIQYTLENLAKAGFAKLVVNTFYLGQQIENFLGDGGQFDVSIQYSRETELLNTGGGIYHALDLLSAGKNEPFVVVNADIWTDYDFSSLASPADDDLAHLVLVDNPSHNPEGDFLLDGNGRLSSEGGEGEQADRKLTFSGISVLRPELLTCYKPDTSCFPLKQVLDQAIADNKVSAEHFKGEWSDVGTPERLAVLDS